MRCSLKLWVAAACLLLSSTAFGAKKEVKPGEEKSKDSKDAKKESSKKKDKKEESPDDGKMSLPLVEGHDSKGLKIPYRGNDGRLQMTFTISVANKVDANHVRMVEAQVETYNESEEREMVIDLPSSVLDLNTRVITSTQQVTIKRSDFEITGQTMEFNTETKQGKLGGNVRMLIYNLENDAPKQEGKARE